MTRFSIGQIVRSNTSAQALVKGAEYLVIDIDERPTPVGSLVYYQLARVNESLAEPGPRGSVWVGNGHLLLSEVAS